MMRPQVVVLVGKGEAPEVRLCREETGWLMVRLGPVAFSIHPDEFQQFRANIADGLGLLRADPAVARAIEAVIKAYEQQTAPPWTRPLA